MGDDEDQKTLLASIDQIIEDKKTWECEKARIEEAKEQAFAEYEAEKARLEEENRKALEKAAIKEEEERLVLELKKEEELARRTEEVARLAEEKARAAEVQEREQRIKTDEPFLGNNIMDFFKRSSEEVITREKEQDSNYVESAEFSTIGETDPDRLGTAVLPEVLDVDVMPAEKKTVVQNSPRKEEIYPEVEVVTSSTPFQSSVLETNDNDNTNYYGNVEVVANDDDDNVNYYGNVEVVTIDDDADMTSAVVDENVVEEQPENPLIVVTLRALDIIFFVAEKALTVGLPGLIDTFKMARTRTDEIQRSGLGKDGWDLLENTSSASKRY